MEKFSRTAQLIGNDGLEKLKNSKVIVFGVGGVGGYTVEALARSGVGEITLVDNDTVALSNVNRQIIATVDTVGKVKVEVMKERVLSINPDCKVNAIKAFYSPDNSTEFNLSSYDYIVDAIDTITSKIDLIVKGTESGAKIISSMGAGNKLDPTAFEVADIYKTSVCPLAKVLRRELKTRGVKSLKVVYSKEEPIALCENKKESQSKKRIPASISFVPSVVGLIIAGEVIKDLIG